MLHFVSSYRYFLALFLSWGVINPATAVELKIGGTGNALGTMTIMAQAYMKENSDTSITVLPSIGSSGAMKAVPKGAVDLGLASRPPKDEEASSGIVGIEYARSPSVLVVNTASNAESLTTEQLIDIYNGKLSHWPDGSLIRPIMRQPDDSTTKQLNSLSSKLANAFKVAGSRSGLQFAYTDQEAVEKMESIPGSFGLTTLALIKSEQRPLRPLTFDGIEPSITNVINGRYPEQLIMHFYLILPQEPSLEVQKFIRFIKSEQGIKILTDNGHMAVN